MEVTYIDQLLPFIGEFGLFQFLYLSILCLFTIPASFQTLIVYFVVSDPPWKCIVNSTKCQIKGDIGKTSKDYELRCKMARNDWTYTEDKSYSIVTQFDLNCDRENLVYVTTSIFFVGMAIGSITFGFLADKYGRAKIMKPATAIALTIGLLSSFSPYYWVFAFSRFFIGFIAPGTVPMFFVVASEIVGPRHRPASGIILWVFFTIGLIILGLVAMATNKWKHLMIYSTGPYVIFSPLLFFLPESSRWLFVNNQIAKCEKNYRLIADVNGKQLPELLLSPSKKQSRNVNPLLLFSSHRMFMKTINIGFAWMVNGLVYYGSSLAAKNLTGNHHRDFILTSLVEFPAAVVAVFSSMYFGRKKTTMIPMFLAGIFIALVSTIEENTDNQNLKNTRLFFGLAGKFFLTLAFDVIYTWTVELYPTQIRTEGMGFVQITSRLGAIASPWIALKLHVYNWRIPFLVMGFLALVSSGLLQFLPETKDLVTAEFLEEEQREHTVVSYDAKEIKSKSKSKRVGQWDGMNLSLVEEEEENDEI